MHPFLIIDRITSLISNPETEWISIKQEKITNFKLYLYIILPLLIIGVLTLLTGNYFVRFAFIESVLYLITSTLIILITSGLLYITSKFFDSKKDFNAAFTLVSYSFIPLLIANIPSNLALFFSWIQILGIYGVYIFWKGQKSMLSTANSKQISQIFLVMIAVFVLMVFFGYLGIFVKAL